MINYLKDAENLFPFTQALRRDIHKHPRSDNAFATIPEVRTSGIVAKALSDLGCLWISLLNACVKGKRFSASFR